MYKCINAFCLIWFIDIIYIYQMSPYRHTCVEHLIKIPNLADLLLICLMATLYVHVCRSPLIYFLIWIKCTFQWIIIWFIFMRVYSFFPRTIFIYIDKIKLVPLLFVWFILFKEVWWCDVTIIAKYHRLKFI